MRPENNANVLIWKAIGPNPAGVTMQSGYFERMGIKSPPAVGDYFVPLRRYIETNRPGGLDSADQAHDTLHRLVISPWTAGQHADINAWLQANERPLATVVEATQRTRYYSPVIPPRNVDRSEGSSMRRFQMRKSVTKWLSPSLLVRCSTPEMDQLMRLGKIC